MITSTEQWNAETLVGESNSQGIIWWLTRCPKRVSENLQILLRYAVVHKRASVVKLLRAVNGDTVEDLLQEADLMLATTLLLPNVKVVKLQRRTDPTMSSKTLHDTVANLWKPPKYHINSQLVCVQDAEQGHTEEAVGSAKHIIKLAHIAINWGTLQKSTGENRVYKGPLWEPHHTMYQPISFKSCLKRAIHTAKSNCTM